MSCYSDPMRTRGASAQRGRRASRATHAPRRHATACWPCHRATWTPETPSPRPLERQRGRRRVFAIPEQENADEHPCEIHHTCLLFGRVELPTISAISLRTESMPRTAVSPFQTLRPPPSSRTLADFRHEQLPHGQAIPGGTKLW